MNAVASIRFDLPIKLECEANRREAWQARLKRSRAQHEAVAYKLRALWGTGAPPKPPLVVELVRLSPGKLDQGGNLTGSFKWVQDAIAKWLGVDDRHDELVRYEYSQRRSPTYGVEVCIRPMEEK